jgi:hypothetical protein
LGLKAVLHGEGGIRSAAVSVKQTQDNCKIGY